MLLSWLIRWAVLWSPLFKLYTVGVLIQVLLVLVVLELLALLVLLLLVLLPMVWPPLQLNRWITAASSDGDVLTDFWWPGFCSNGSNDSIPGALDCFSSSGFSSNDQSFDTNGLVFYSWTSFTILDIGIVDTFLWTRMWMDEKWKQGKIREKMGVEMRPLDFTSFRLRLRRTFFSSSLLILSFLILSFSFDTFQNWWKSSSGQWSSPYQKIKFIPLLILLFYCFLSLSILARSSEKVVSVVKLNRVKFID